MLNKKISNNKYDLLRKLLISEKTIVRETVTGCLQVRGGWHIKPRALSEHLVYYICSNCAVGIVAGRHVELGAGELIWVLPETHHEFFCFSRKKPPRLYHFRFKLDNPSVKASGCEWFIGRNLGDSLNLVSMYYHERQVALPDVNCRVKNILSLLLSNVKNSWASNSPGNNLHGFNRQTINRIVEYCDARVKERPSPGELAKKMRFSEDYFSRLFKQTFGLSPRQWLVKKRIMTIAEDLQNSEKSISEIAYEYGYSDIFFFSRQFKQITGKSPRNWIRQ